MGVIGANPSELGDRLRAARTSAKITQESAASSVGIARTTLVAIEAGERQVRPAELAKLPLILFLAHHLARKQGQIESFTATILPALFVCGQLAALVVIEPDLGTAIMFVSVTVVLLFFAGMPLKYFAGFAALSIPAFYFLAASGLKGAALVLLHDLVNLALAL